MKKSLLVILVFLFGFSLFGQALKPITKQIQQYHQQNRPFKRYDLFVRNKAVTQSGVWQAKAEDAVIFDLNHGMETQLVKEHPKTLSFSFPYHQETITVELYKKKILTPGFHVENGQHETLSYTPGVYYRGIVKGHPNSVAAFSFFRNRIIGVASIAGFPGNIVVGKLRHHPHYIAYTDNTLTKDNPFQCGVEDLPAQTPSAAYHSTMLSSPHADNCVEIYYEVGHQPYVDHGSSVSLTTDWLTAIHNNISTLYENAGVSISLNNLMIWTDPAPYTGSYDDRLAQFANTRTNFDGDLAVLVNSPATTSVAYLNSLCNPYHYAYSAVDQSFPDVPTYSWSIEATTHEIGHAFGSPHTHACAWNGNNTAIDGCGPAAGYSEGCDNGPIPYADGGTIMSYCHLLPNVGINFANGFGPQPSALIRSTIDSKYCLGTDCIPCNSIEEVTLSNISTDGFDFQVLDGNPNSDWQMRVYQYGTDPGYQWNPISGNETFTVSDLAPNTYYILEVRNDCTTNEDDAIKKIVLTDGDYCHGDKFYDTGGKDGSYSRNESIVKTFYPGEDESLTMAFTSFHLLQGHAYMTVYDGESTEAPVFQNGDSLSGNLNNALPVFESTNPAGAITVKFTSDDFFPNAGWEAQFTCDALGVASPSPRVFKVYPNPAKNILHIAGEQPVKKIEIRDISGRLLKSNSPDAINPTVNLKGLSSGVYFLIIHGNQHSETQRLIKR